jgi:hypothetical protein
MECTASLDASSGRQIRHWLFRAGTRKVNHVHHVAAATRVRLDTDGPGHFGCSATSLCMAGRYQRSPSDDPKSSTAPSNRSARTARPSRGASRRPTLQAQNDDADAKGQHHHADLCHRLLSDLKEGAAS